MNETEDDLTEKRLKVVLVGDSGAGKTSIAVKFCYDEFTRQYTPTAGVDFFMKNLSLGPFKNVTLHIWDVGGLALRGAMLDKYLYAADLIIFVYDVTNSSSFDVMEEWMTAVTAITERTFRKSPLIVIVGNKCDMEHQRTVKRERSHRYAAEKGIIYHDMSARTGESVSLSIANLSAKVLGVQLTRMDQEFHKPIVTAEIGDTVDVTTIKKIVKRQPHRKSYPNNNYPTLPLSKSSVCSLQ
ncbi:ras-related protein Rab-28 [Fopius arisanus]|uniref:RAB28_0 protein n=1 Tax=Fopius arisanus TaxID=64838 RepID=A0A0C9RTY1_9HYME|nr:PREDICTED: ras-related protein Rab-28-like [Fopius arisanus]XP_011310016.1 PREDICTED: ras-related protein Rab-28-like [Fopius arisanus]XP_011310017.1 PREDICTED: ras-related protein Rab-28-like [Fopius arisanus]